MTLYARGDLQFISIPATSGGCGDSHSRPVRNGAPDKTWKLDCGSCEEYLKGSRKAKILKTTPGDVKAGIPAKQERVNDSDPMWSSTADTIPLTPDEVATRHVKIEKGENQLRALESIATLAKAGIDLRSRPDVLYFLRENGLPDDIIQGKVVCLNGHDNAPGVKFCSECGSSMTAKAEIEAPEELITEIPLDRLHIATLRKQCRESGVPDKGTKNDLIKRLEAARGRVA